VDDHVPHFARSPLNAVSVRQHGEENGLDAWFVAGSCGLNSFIAGDISMTFNYVADVSLKSYGVAADLFLAYARKQAAERQCVGHWSGWIRRGEGRNSLPVSGSPVAHFPTRSPSRRYSWQSSGGCICGYVSPSGWVGSPPSWRSSERSAMRSTSRTAAGPFAGSAILEGRNPLAALR
jgi:hypothetical protein